MPVPSSLTLNYNAILASTLFNYRKSFVDNISALNAFLYHLMKKDKYGYKELSSLGDRAAIPLLYEVGTADSYSGYDQLSVEPMDGFTMAFYDWAQCAIPISISGMEEAKNEGEAKLFDLLKGKIQQAEIGIKEFFGKCLLRGAGGSTVTTPYTSAANGSVFVLPLPLIVKFDPTTSTVVGNINQSTYAWWRNKTTTSAADSFAKFLKELRHMHNECSKTVLGRPNLHLCTQGTRELYEACLATYHQNEGWAKADIPFDSVTFKGRPVVWDDWVPDAYSGTVTQTYGSWYMLNTESFQIQAYAKKNFAPTNMQTPENQDARVSHILWYGGLTCGNRAANGVIGKIVETTAA
jgi:hypothetical protein